MSLFAERKAAREFNFSDEQTAANPAQPREWLENAGERYLEERVRARY
jgi:hypothetical protein